MSEASGVYMDATTASRRERVPWEERRWEEARNLVAEIARRALVDVELRSPV